MVNRKSLRPKRRKPKKKRQSIQLLKIFIGLVILIALVVLAAFLTNHFIQQRQPTILTGNLPASTQKSMHGFPFEIYPKEDAFIDKKKKKKPAVAGKPKVAIIIDDIGYDRAIAKKLIHVGFPITLSILPEAPFQDSILKAARDNHIDIMLHQPMEPDEYPKINPGPGTLLMNMSPDELIEKFNKNIDKIPNIVGVNNHMGSKMTASASQMRQIFFVLKKRNLFFVDSRTTPLTICRSSASLFKIPFGERDVFIDHFQDPVFIKNQMFELVRIASTHGEAIGIAHPYNKTLVVLQELIPQLKQKVDFVPVMDVVHM